MALKKQTALLVHLLFLCLFLVGMTFIYFNENYGRGLSWVQEESYADTFSFTEQLESDVEISSNTSTTKIFWNPTEN